MLEFKVVKFCFRERSPGDTKNKYKDLGLRIKIKIVA